MLLVSRLAVVVAVVGLGLVATPPAAHAAPSSFDIPIVFHEEPDGRYLATARISINGSAPILVGLDTGTSYLVLNPGVITGPTTPVTSTSVAFDATYDGSGVEGTVALGQMAVLDAGGLAVATTPAPVAFVDGATCDPSGGCPAWISGMQGVWGIGPTMWPSTDHDPAHDLYSPIAQFGDDYEAGYTMDFTTSSPFIRVGSVLSDPTDTAIQRRAGPVKPNGQKEWANPEMCWSVSTATALASGCAVTVIDSGQMRGVISGPRWDPVVDPVTAPPTPGSGRLLTGLVPAGALVTWSAPGATTPFAGVGSTGSDAPRSWGQFSAGDGAPLPQFNTGADFYRLHRVSYDDVSGRTFIAPTPGVAAAPTATASVGGAGVTVRWDSPATVTTWAVSVTDAAGALVQRLSVPGDQRQTVVTGLAAGASYTVTVAGVTGSGLGAASAPASVTLSLPATGVGAVPLWLGITLVAVGAALILAGRRRRRV